jgi:selenocysteine lyase/cysteine desulfurase
MNPTEEPSVDWNAFREHFPTTRRWAFFDHAAVAPPSAPARDALIEWANDLAINGGLSEPRWLKRLEEVRRLAGQLLNADPLDIAFIKNTSEGIGIVAEGFPWRSGDNMITGAEEYPANIYPWLNLAGRGVEVRRVASRGNRVEIDDIRAAMDDHTRLVSLSFVEYASGFHNDLDNLGALCRERGVYFFVDAIQGLGMLPLDVQRTPVDFLAADGHKWLLGPEGAGLFWVRRDLVDLLHPVGVGWNSVVGAWNFSTIDFRLKPHAGRWESGSLNVGGISALGASIELLLRTGIPAVVGRVRRLTDQVCDKARQLGLEVFSSRRESDWSGIVSLVAPGDLRQVVRRCREAGVVINQRGGRLRISPHCYNTIEEVERLMATLIEVSG